MNIAVRYYSRAGNKKLLADTIASEAHVKAISVDSAVYLSTHTPEGYENLEGKKVVDLKNMY